MARNDEWGAARPGWFPLADVPAALGVPAARAAAVLRPGLETGAIPWRWRPGADPPHAPRLRLRPGGVIYGAFDMSPGWPLEPPWAVVFSADGARWRDLVEVPLSAAAAALAGAAPPSEAADTAAPLYSMQALRAWYRLRIGTWPATCAPPSEADDLAAARAHFAREIPRDLVREVRRGLAPESWKKPGPRGRRA